MSLHCRSILAGVALILLHNSVTFAQFELIGKAVPDEFYNGLGQPYIPLGQQGPDDEGQPKVNQDYLWGLAAEGRMVWFGTGGNSAALAAGQVASGLQEAEPVEVAADNGVLCRAWEFGSSQFPGLPQILKNFIGDWRPPRIYQYNAETQQLVDRTPNDSRLNYTLGLRSAGISNGVALLAGPSVFQVGIYLFAFDANTGRYLGSQYLSEYSNIRRWVNARGGMYTSVLNTFQGFTRGSVLKWTGNRWSPFQFECVGRLDNEGAYMAYHDGRLFVGTWPSTSLISGLVQGLDAEVPLCGIWMSPKLGLGGLNPLHTFGWKKVWDPTEYDPDPVLVQAHAIGAMESYGGSLYFGTITFPGQGIKAFYLEYGYLPPGNQQLNTERTPFLVKATGYGVKDVEPTVELLYADSNLLVYTPDGMGSGTWAPQLNVSGAPALYGSGGFGDVYNRYFWSSVVHAGRLYFGTFDVRALSDVDRVVEGTANARVGGDVWVFNNANSAATAVTRNGGGNQLNHGFRNMVSTAYGLFAGTANSANLLTDPDDEYPEGGWEFLRLIE